MASRRLTKDQKENYATKILYSKTKDKEEKIIKDLLKFFNDFYSDFMKPFKKTVDSLPDDFFRYKRRINMYYGKGYSEYLFVTLDEAILIPECFIDYNDVKIDKDNFKEKFLIRLENISKENTILKKYREELYSELSKLFHSCNTTKQLIEAFPDIDKYISIEGKEHYPLVANTEKLKKLLSV